jgi:hypothetical protein
MDFSNYTYGELLESLNKIDGNKFPERVLDIENRIRIIENSPEFREQISQSEESKAEKAIKLVSWHKHIGVALIVIGILQQVFALLTSNGFGVFYLYLFDFGFFDVNAQNSPYLLQVISYLLSLLFVIAGVGCLRKRTNLIVLGVVPFALLALGFKIGALYWFVQPVLSLSFTLSLLFVVLNIESVALGLLICYLAFYRAISSSSDL